MIHELDSGIKKAILLLALALTAGSVSAATFFAAPDFTAGSFSEIETEQLFFIGQQSMPLIGLNQEETLSESIFPAVPNGSFAVGTEEALGLVLQSNLERQQPSSPQPGSNLILLGPTAEVPFGRVTTSSQAESLDIIIEPPLYPNVIWAMSLAVRAGDQNDQPIAMRLYNNAGTLLGSTNVAAGTEKVGFLMDANGLLRVNVSADDFIEVGEIRLYSKVGPPDALASTLVSSSETTFLDVPVGISVNVTDERGQLRDMGGDEVLIIATPLGSSLSQIIDQEDGSYTNSLSRISPGFSTVSAYLGSISPETQIGEIVVEFTTGRAADISAFESSGELLDFNGGTNTATVSLVDIFSNPPPADVRVAFASSDTNRATVVAEAISETNGTATVEIIGGAQVGEVTITATIDSADGNVASNATRSISLLVRDPDATVTISGWTAQDRLYDRTTNATVIGDAILDGIQVGHEVELVGTPAFYFRTPQAGEDKRVDVRGLSLGGAQAELYTLQLPTLTASINPVTLTVTNAVAQDKPFDTTTEALIVGAELIGVLEGDSVSLLNAEAGTFASAAIGEDIVVETAMTLEGADAGNYSLEQPLLTASIFDSPNLFLRSAEAEGDEFAALTNLFLLGLQSMPTVAVGAVFNLGTAEIQPGVPAGAFSNGTDTVVGLTLRSNATVADTLSTAQGSNLILIGPDDPGGFSRVGLDSRQNSFDLVMQPPGSVGLVNGLSMSLRTATGNSPIRVRLYDNDERIGEHVYPANTQRIGIRTTMAGWLRLNVYAADDDIELGEIRIYSAVGPADATASSLQRLSADTVYGDQTAEFRVTIRDENNVIRAQGGEDIFFTSSGGALINPSDFFDGTYGIQLQFTNDTATSITVRAYLGTAAVPELEIGSASVDFIAARAVGVASLGLADLIININDGTTILTGRVVNARGNPPPAGVRVLLTSSETNRATIAAAAFTDATGSFEAVLSAGAQPGATLITATLDADDEDVATAASQQVELLIRDPDATVTITGWTAEDSVYNQTSNAVVTGTAVLTGLDTEHDVTLAGEAAFHFETSQVGENKRIFISGLTLTGAEAELYTLELPILFASILPVELSITNAVAQNKPFDGTTDAVIEGAMLSGVLPGDAVELLNATSGSFASTAIGEGIAVQTSMSLTGADAGNYTLIQPVLTADILFSSIVFLRSTAETGDEFDLIAPLTFIGKQAIPATDAILSGPSVFPRTAIGPFTNGTEATLGITLQSHGQPQQTSTSVAGTALIVVNDGFGRIGPSSRANGLDVIMQPPGFVGLVQGVSLAARTTGGESAIRVRAYDNDELMGEFVFPAGTQRIGIRTYVRGLIRLNLYAEDGDLEIGDIRLYSALGPPNGIQSSLERLTPESLFADQLAEFEVVVRDADGEIRDLGGDDILYTASLGTLRDFADFGDGTYRVKLNYTNDVSATVTVRAYLGSSTNDPLAGEVTADFLPARAGVLADFAADEPRLIRGTSTVARLYVQSMYGQPRSNVRVQLSSANPDVISLSDSELLSATDGEITFTLTAGIEGNTTIAAAIDGDDEKVMEDVSESIAAAVMVQLVAFQQTNDQVRLEWTTIPGRDYHIQRVPDLVETPIFTNWLTRTATQEFDQVEDAIGEEKLFYRVVPAEN